MNLFKNLNENIKIVSELLGVGESFDVIGKEILIGNHRAFFVMIDGFAKDHIMLLITERLQKLKIDEVTLDSISEFMKENIAYMESEVFSDFNVMKDMVLSGSIALFIDGFDRGVLIDAREYPVRSPQEPDLEKVTRGPRDGFVETIIFNTALIRRRVKDTGLRFELKSVGKRSKTNVAIAYVKDFVDENYIEEIKEKIDNIEIDSLIMAEKSLSEILIPNKWYNPLPQVRYTERPDVASAHLMEGHILLIVDTTPSVIILPTSIFHFTQHGEDYYQNPLVGTYIRWIRFFAMFLGYILIPAWILFVEYGNSIPSYLQLILPEDKGRIPIFIQFLLLDGGLDILRISSIHTPNSLTTSLGIIGGLILGQLAIDVGIFIPHTVLYMAVAGICTFCTPSIEFSMAIRMFRLLLILLTGIFKLPGFIIANLLIIIMIFTTKNSSKKSYTWPLIPFNAKSLFHILFRTPIPKAKKSDKS